MAVVKAYDAALIGAMVLGTAINVLWMNWDIFEPRWWPRWRWRS